MARAGRRRAACAAHTANNTKGPTHLATAQAIRPCPVEADAQNRPLVAGQLSSQGCRQRTGRRGGHGTEGGAHGGGLGGGGGGLMWGNGVLVAGPTRAGHTGSLCECPPTAVKGAPLHTCGRPGLAGWGRCPFLSPFQTLPRHAVPQPVGRRWGHRHHAPLAHLAVQGGRHAGVAQVDVGRGGVLPPETGA